MDSSILLVNAYNLLQTANENLRRLQVELVRVSGLWTLFQDNPETRSSDRPEYWVDSAGQSDSFRNEDADAWVFDARSRGLFSSTSALVEELRSLGERKRNLEDIQQKLRLTINTVSRPSLRSLHILDLPDEILSRVFDFVEGYRPDIPSLWHIVSRDLKNCRLACRAFCRVSSRLFLRSVSVDLRVSSISRFEEISRHPIISKGVRVVRAVLHFYDPRLSENFDDFILHSATELEQRVESMEWMKTWEFHKVSEKDGLRVIERLKAISASWRRISSAIQAQNLTEDDHQHLLLLRKAHQKYQRLFSDQEELLNSGMFLQKVAAGIDRMPRARILHFLDWDFNLPREVSPFDCEDLNVPVYEAPLRAMNYYTAYKSATKL
ncbi:hypothetical protein S7711_09704 [Stachybotrys chartarum IBT 7711]|uniref:Uncharacterized protein n=1 Tax=Stachybotrys chartarum (strain CBS 109288 / IBT 7711) TaxID=1280523 RepID=A0A084B292_STACB|nr:hypothetical protein S7711_09704 [Stachybotrys chartarum IBT 7711]